MSIKYSPLYAESWNVAYRLKPIGSIFDDKANPFCVIPNSPKYWAADPMVFEYRDTKYIFAELYDYALCRGTIGYTVYDSTGFSKWKQVIVEDFHMSYPNLFLFENEIYMIPETCESGKLLLYKAVDFPDKWEQVRVIKDGVKWVDTTLMKTEDGYIGFTEQPTEPLRDYLLRFDPDLNLLSKELIAENSATMRCGGRVFLHDDYLVRVCQDCEEKYGGALIFRFCDQEKLTEIKNEKITPEQLRFESEILLDGMHTYTALSDIEVIDIKTRRFNALNLLFRIINKIR